MDIQYCKKCVTPNTRPRIELDKDDVCNACRYAEQKKQTNWEAKEKELRELVDKYRNPSGYDCVIPVSGGKDSHFQVHYAKNILNLNPLCVTFMPAMPTKIGNKNRRNLVEKLGVDHIAVTPDPKVHRRLCRIMFKEHGNPFIPWIQGIYSAVTRIAVEKNISLLLYGENGELEYGGTPNSKSLSREGVQLRVRSNRPNWKEPEDWHEYKVPKQSLFWYTEPSKEDFERVGIKRTFIGDYVPWNGNYNLYVALNIIGGFKTLERRTVGTYTHGSSIDDDMDEFYLWMLWVKFGFGRASKSASPDIREGKLTRENAIELVRKYDGEFPWYIFDRVLEYMEMSEEEFWEVIKKFVGDKDNLEREKEEARKMGIPEEMLPNRIPAWEKIADGKWRHARTIHGEERILEIPMKKPDHYLGQAK